MMDRFLTDKDYSHFCNVIEESGTANVLKDLTFVTKVLRENYHSTAKTYIRYQMY